MFSNWWLAKRLLAQHTYSDILFSLLETIREENYVHYMETSKSPSQGYTKLVNLIISMMLVSCAAKTEAAGDD